MFTLMTFHSGVKEKAFHICQADIVVFIALKQYGDLRAIRIYYLSSRHYDYYEKYLDF